MLFASSAELIIEGIVAILFNILANLHNGDVVHVNIYLQLLILNFQPLNLLHQEIILLFLFLGFGFVECFIFHQTEVLIPNIFELPLQNLYLFLQSLDISLTGPWYKQTSLHTVTLW